MISGTVIANSLSYLAYGKAVTLDGSPARHVLGATNKNGIIVLTKSKIKRSKDFAIWHLVWINSIKRCLALRMKNVKGETMG